MNRLHLLTGLLILLAGILRLTEPLHDGDLFWHMGYGRWMLEHRTLIPDHTVFSWTPTQNHVIYCAWLGEFFLYAVHSCFGMNGLFVLRYATVLGLGLAHYLIARRRFGCPPLLASALIFVWLLASYSGTAIKPELLSFALWNGLILLWANSSPTAFENRSTSLRAAPLLLLLWANTHGAFFFGLLFLTCSWLGSVMDERRFLPRHTKLSLSLLAACWGATLLTPYGWNYHIQQVTQRLQSAANQLAVDASRHWEPVYTWNNLKLHLFEYWLVMACVLLWLTARRWGQQPCWQWLVPNLALAGLSLLHIRTNYLWPPLWLYSVLVLLETYPGASLNSARLRAFLTVLITLVALRTCWESYTSPYLGQYFGLGLGYQNPEKEVEFIERHSPPGLRLYNSYDHGGYILWKLGPTKQVMMDSRAFPYREWFGDYLAFAQGQNFSAFVAKYPATAALISWRDRDCLRQFIRDPSWYCIYTGPSGAVFSRQKLVTASDPSRFQKVLSSDQLLLVFAGLLDLGDIAAAEELIAQATENHVSACDPRVSRALSLHLQGLRRVQAKDYEGALVLLEEAAQGGFYVNHSLLDALRQWKRGPFREAGQPQEH